MGLVLCLSAQPVNAAEASSAGTVLIAFEPRTQAASERLRQEIEALGFDVRLTSDANVGPSLESFAERSGAIAAIHVKPSDAGGVEMTVIDRATGKTVHRELPRVNAGEPAGEELIAARTVELLRASLMELDADHPARGDVPAPPRVAALVQREDESRQRKRSGALSLAAGPALLLMPEWQPSAQLWLEASWLADSGLGLAAALQSALSPAHLTRQEGAVDLSATSYRLGLVWGSRPDPRGLSGRLLLGWSLSALHVRGNASSPYLGSSTDTLAWSPWFGVAGRVRLAAHLALSLEASGSLALPRETIRVAGRPVADFSRPACFIALGPELSWP